MIIMSAQLIPVTRLPETANIPQKFVMMGILVRRTGAMRRPVVSSQTNAKRMATLAQKTAVLRGIVTISWKIAPRFLMTYARLTHAMLRREAAGMIRNVRLIKPVTPAATALLFLCRLAVNMKGIAVMMETPVLLMIFAYIVWLEVTPTVLV